MKNKMCFMKKLIVCVMVFAMTAGLLPDMQVQAAKKAPAVKSITVKNGSKNVTKKTILMTEGKYVTLKVTVKPAKAKKSISYKSSKPAVAKVTKKGKVTARKPGTSKITITVRGKNGKKKATYVKVNVKARTIAVKSITASISKSQMMVGDTAMITASVSPKNASNKKLTYTSSNQGVAAVNSRGQVTAKVAGTARITVKASNGKSAAVNVTVKDRSIDVQRIELGILPTATIIKGSTARMSASVIPANATDKTLTYTSSDEAVAVVDADGKVTAKETGKAAIIVKASNGKQAEMEITVVDKYELKITEHKIVCDEEGHTIYGKLYAPDQEGTWPVVILSHGYNGYNEQFVNDCRLFAENGYMAYAYDFRGGCPNSQSTGLKTTDMTIFTEKSDLLTVFEDIKKMENVDTEQIFLLGGSMGGLVTTLAAEELSGQVKGMILYFPAMCVADDQRKNFPDITKIGDTTNVMGMDLGKEFFTSIREFYPENVIGGYPNPVLIIWGDKDTIVPRNYVDMAKEKYENAELIVVPGVGHDSSPLIFRNSALSFMKGY